MHPKALLDATADLVGLVLKFDHPADQVVSRFFRDHREFGPRERATLAETVYTVLRKKLLFDHLSPSGSGPKSAGWQSSAFTVRAISSRAPSTTPKSAGSTTATPSSRTTCSSATATTCPSGWWRRSRQQLGDQFWPLVESLQQPAPLDLRVNALSDKRPDLQKELAKASIKAVADAVLALGPAGRRQAGAAASWTPSPAARSRSQDEGSQLLALLLDAKRGEMVVDFCAGAGGKTLAMGAAMRNTGRLYAFDTSGAPARRAQAAAGAQQAVERPPGGDRQRAR